MYFEFNSFICPSIIIFLVNSTADTQSYLQTYVLLSVMSVINVMLMLLLVSTLCIINDLKVASSVRIRKQYQNSRNNLWTVAS